MAFNLSTRTIGDVTVIDLSGRLELGQGSVVLREAIKNLATGAKVIINLTELAFIDTSGLGELVSAHTKAKNEGACLKLTGIPGRVEKLFQMTKLDRILDVYATEAEAIQSCSGTLFSTNRFVTETVANSRQI